MLDFAVFIAQFGIGVVLVLMTLVIVGTFFGAAINDDRLINIAEGAFGITILYGLISIALIIGSIGIHLITLAF